MKQENDFSSISLVVIIFFIFGFIIGMTFVFCIIIFDSGDFIENNNLHNKNDLNKTKIIYKTIYAPCQRDCTLQRVNSDLVVKGNCDIVLRNDTNELKGFMRIYKEDN